MFCFARIEESSETKTARPGAPQTYFTYILDLTSNNIIAEDGRWEAF